MTKTIIKQYMFDDMLEAGVIKKFDESNKSHKIEYYVSIYGNFYSRNVNTGKIIQMKLVPDGAGYLRTNINGKTVKAHIVVAETFIRPRDREKGEVINHLDGNKLNNELSNIEITNQSLNVKHAWENKLAKNNRARKLSFQQAEQIRMLHRTEGLSYNALSRMFNCTTSSILQIINFQTYKAELKRNV
ncbi:HNH endonuclease [Mammaliicoccus sciuri]|uniref:HNH endonuclease n=1 Tax=Mammaliicoccus sciuri TaxID=1296 RepID=UPI002DB684BA|nr:HNH endonuclease [Mammaliicoccus sciuri]MEB6233820.1 HNH endonuclease [Mammaliicoccus sciuri]